MDLAGMTDDNLLGGRDALTLGVRCNDGSDNAAFTETNRF